MKKSILMIAMLLVLTLVLSACNVTGVQDTSVNEMETSVAETVSVLGTQLVLALPTQMPTCAPTCPPAPTNTVPPTATNTAMYTATPTITATLARTATLAPSLTPTPMFCSIVSKAPADGTVYDPNAPFDTRWKVKNISGSTWTAANSDVRYKSGTQWFDNGVTTYDLPSDVAVNGEYELILDSTAPGTSGAYSMTWEIVSDTGTLCTMTAYIQVR